MENRERFYKLMEERKEIVKKNYDSNCIGTAFYLIGEQEEDNSELSRENIESKINKMKKLEFPQKGALLKMSSEGKVQHLAVISNLFPFRVYSRNGAHSEFKEQNFEEMCKEYKWLNNPSIEYFEPGKLNQLMEEN
ncbi:MAG: hypothetical protein U9Q99_01510 [Nanoarchaeota archaeon]|nr:hypothetical protein [Nanoarchaeota archaeon]